MRPLFAPNIFSAAEVAQGKPSPDLFLFAARAMGAAPSDCLVIEDSVAGVAAARAAGMTVFGFVGGSHFSRLDEGVDLTAAGPNSFSKTWRGCPTSSPRGRRRQAQAIESGLIHGAQVGS